MNLKSKLLTFILLLSTVHAVYAVVEKKTGEAYYHFMMGAMKENSRDYAGAILEYREALKFDPDASEIFAKLASLYAQTDRIAEAIADAQKAIERNPQNPEAHRMLGQIYMQKLYAGEGSAEDMTNAIREFEEVYRIDAQDDAAMLTLSQLYLQNKQPEKAVQVLADYVKRNPETPNALMSLASAYQQLNQPEQALSWLLKYLELRPDNVYVLQQAAELQQKAGNTKEAFDLQKRAYEIDPENQAVLRGYIDMLLRNRQAAEAVAILEPIVQKDPGNADWSILLARALQGTGEQDRAELLMQKVLSAHPSFDSRLALVQIYEEGKKFDEAIRLLTTMLQNLEADETQNDTEKIGGRALIYSHLGYTSQQKKEYLKAIEYYQKARQFVGPEDTGRIDFYIALNYRNLKDWDKALEVANGIVQKDANDLDAWELLSLIYEEKGDTANSDQILKRLIEKNPDSPNYRILQAERLQQRQKYEESVAYLKEILPKFQDNEQVLFLLGAANERLKRYDESEEYFKQVLAKDPDDPNALNYLGYMLVDRGVRLQEALGYIKRALEMEKDNGAFLDSLGWAYFKLNQLDLAEDNLRMAAEKLDDNPVVHDHLGDLYFRQGKFEQAIEHWQEAIRTKNYEVDPEFIQKKIDDTRQRLTN